MSCKKIYNLSMYEVTGYMVNAIDNMPVTYALFSTGGASVVLVLKNKKVYMVLIPIIVHDCLLEIAISAQEPRFILPTIGCAILRTVIFGERKRVRFKEENYV